MGNSKDRFREAKGGPAEPYLLSEEEFPYPTAVADLPRFRFREVAQARQQKHARQGANRRGNAGSRDAGVGEAFLCVFKTDVSKGGRLRSCCWLQSRKGHAINAFVMAVARFTLPV